MPRFLGIDPGFGRLGWAVLESKASSQEAVAFGCLETKNSQKLAERLRVLADDLRKIIRRYKPNAAALEELFFFENLKTAINVAQARGVVMLVLQECGVPICELTPLQVKQSLTGYGRADKKQMQKMVQMVLRLKEIPQPDDAADALAIAIAAVPYLKERR